MNTNVQCYNFLAYANTLLVARAANTNGTSSVQSGIVTTGVTAIAATTVNVTGSTTGLSVGQYLTFGTDKNFYEIKTIVANTSITLERGLELAVPAGATVNVYTATINATVEAVSSTAIGEAVTNNYEYTNRLIAVGNFEEYEQLETSIAFVNDDSKLKFLAKNPGAWGNNIEIAIANPADFGTDADAFDGIALDDLYDYFPTGTEIGVIIRLGDTIVETFTVDLDVNGKDSNNRSSYIENVINRQSNYVFVKDNTSVDDVKSYLDLTTLKLVKGSDSIVGMDDIITATELFINPEEIDIDVVIANEFYPIAAVNLAEARKDCIAFVGAKSDIVGKKSTDAVSSIVTWRKTGEMNVNSMFVCAVANYKYMYDHKVA